MHESFINIGTEEYQILFNPEFKVVGMRPVDSYDRSANIGGKLIELKTDVILSVGNEVVYIHTPLSAEELQAKLSA